VREGLRSVLGKSIAFGLRWSDVGVRLVGGFAMRRDKRKLALAVLATMLSSGIVHAGDLDTNATDPVVTAPVPWLFGDWGGYRTRLLQQGIDFQFGYTSEIAYNAQGGIQSEVANADQYLAGVTLNLDRLFGLHDSLFQISITERTGRNLSDDAELGTLQQVQEIFGRGQTVRLTQFFFDQKYFNGLVDWKVGRAPFGGDFAAFDCDFENLTFCGAAPGNLVGNYIWNWPISQWMTRLKFNLTGFGYFQFAVFDDNPKYLGTQDQVLPVFFPGSTGALIPVELGWLPTFGGGTLPGSYKIGAWYDTSNAPNVVDVLGTVAATNPSVPVVSSQGRYGGYINFEQQVTRNGTSNSRGGLSLFLNAVFADERTSTLDRQIAGGLLYTGPLSWRPDDDVAFAVGTTHVNNRVASAEALENALGQGLVAVQESEYEFELYYTIRPINGFLIRPNLQYVLYPGGTSQNTNVIVFGLKTVANF
jgi:porin